MAPDPMMDEGETASGDISQGYSLEISVLPDGTFKLGAPEPLEVEAEEETGAPGEELGEDFPSIGGLMKALLEVVKRNPVGGDEQQNFEAGFNG